MLSLWPSIRKRWQVLLAFAAIYFLWGATFLSIRIAIESIPPFYMAGMRFLIAGAILYLWARRSSVRPSWAQWRGAIVIGALLMLGGNGGVTYSEQFIPSGMAALIVATIPIWIVVLEWLHRDTRPNLAVVIGLLLGLGGIGLLVEHGQATGNSSATLLGLLILLPAAIAWATGSYYSPRVVQPSSPLLATGMQMLAGGAWLCLAGALMGETSAIRLDRITPASFLSLLYLIIFGSLVGYTAYIWLLRVSKPGIVSTYAFVNPVVAVFLGWLFFREPITPQMIGAAAIIIMGISLIIAFRSKAAVLKLPQPLTETVPVRAARLPTPDR
jgi:drug/metabolite transporter (DMT)-like permease